LHIVTVIFYLRIQTPRSSKRTGARSTARLQTHVHIAGLIERATSKAEQMTPASGRRTNSRCRRSRHVRSIMQRRRAYQRTRLASVRDAAHNGNGRADRTGLDRVDRKATYSRAMDVPEGALLAVKDLPVELVSFLIHSKHNTTRTHTHSTCIRSHSANVVVLPLKPLLAHTKILIDDRAASEPVTHNRLIIMGNGSRVPWFIMLDSSST